MIFWKPTCSQMSFPELNPRPSSQVDKKLLEQGVVEQKRDHLRNLILLLSRAIQTGQLHPPFNPEDLLKLYKAATE
jgi:hypothetical protein